MGDFTWPSNIRPLTSRNYSTERGGNLVASPLTGGVPLIALDTTLESPPFKLNFILDDLQYQVLLNFYDAILNHGANSFKMNLDSGSGVEEHQCYMIPGTWKVSKPSNVNWYLALSVIAETTSSQLDDTTDLYDLYLIYGDDLPLILSGLGEWVEAMPDE